MTEKFDISEKDELMILKYWLKDNNNLLKIPENLNGRITEEQSTNLFSHYQDLGNNDEGGITREIEKKITELENKFQKQREQTFFFILKKEFKEESAKLIVWLLMSIIGFIFGFLVSSLSK